MALRASPQGLEIVDQARRRKGWGRQASIWYQTALTSLATLRRFWQGEPIQPETFIRICQAVGLESWGEIVDCMTEPIPPLSMLASTVDWDEVPDVSVFYGRTEELATLASWIVPDHCRLVALLGLGGIGKTALAVKLVQQLVEGYGDGEMGGEAFLDTRDKSLSVSRNASWGDGGKLPRPGVPMSPFQFVIWRSLRHAPPIEHLLAELVSCFSNRQETQADLSRLLDYLRTHRCLLVLDQAETVLSSGSPVGRYRQGYEGYGELFRRVGVEHHQSCLVLTSREKPREIASLEGGELPVRSLLLASLREAADEILKEKGLLYEERAWQTLTQNYRGNPLALKIVSTMIKELFAGSVSDFLRQDTLVLGDFRQLLDQQFERLSDLEKEIVYELATHQGPISLAELANKISLSKSRSEVIEALVSLRRRSLVELIETGASEVFFTLQPIVMKYVKRIYPEGF